MYAFSITMYRVAAASRLGVGLGRDVGNGVAGRAGVTGAAVGEARGCSVAEVTPDVVAAGAAGLRPKPPEARIRTRPRTAPTLTMPRMAITPRGERRSSCSALVEGVTGVTTHGVPAYFSE
jgi:hypothetical protein